MTIINKENFHEIMAGRDEQKKIARVRKKDIEERSVPIGSDELQQISMNPESRWVILDHRKTVTKLGKEKSPQEQFEDEVWDVFYSIGFEYISKDRHCEVLWGKEKSASHQIDVLVIDDEIAIFIECKRSDVEERNQLKSNKNFKQEIEHFYGMKKDFDKAIKKVRENRNIKIVQVFATKGYQLKANDLKRLEETNIYHLDEQGLEYWRNLINRLGGAARYQLLGDLLEGVSIPNMMNKVYAVRGKMGGKTYYSFSIEPERLLKIAYVLHKQKGQDNSPAYQRIIQKPRLRSIQKYVDEEDGYFPNSIILSYEDSNRSLNFDIQKHQIEDTKTMPGVLTLPNKYKSVFLVDGQHRLYAYADSKYAKKNSLPVVLFEGLDRDEQIQMFMKINQNQKAVSKNLRNTLESELLWGDKNFNNRNKAIVSRLALAAGEDKSSPLHGRVLTGEDQITEYKYITLDAIIRGVNQTKFLGNYKNNKLIDHGYFHHENDPKETLSHIREIIFGYFDKLKDSLESEWENKKDSSFILYNPSVTALIIVLGDIVKHLLDKEEINSLDTENTNAIIEKISSNYLPGIIGYIQNLPIDEKTDLRKKFGSGGIRQFRAAYQRAIKEYNQDFNPQSLVEYEENERRQFDQKIYDLTRTIEKHLRQLIEKECKHLYGKDWFERAAPLPVKKDSVDLAVVKNHGQAISERVEPWDCVTLTHLKEIFTDSSNWTKGPNFQTQLMIKGHDQKGSWLDNLIKIRNKNSHDNKQIVTDDDEKFMEALNGWLIRGEDQAIKEYYSTE